MEQQQTNNALINRSSQPNNKCKQLKMHFHKLLITICGDTNKSSRRRFWYISLIFTISSYIMCIADVLTEYRWQKQPPIILPDLGFDFAELITPFVCNWITYPDIAVIISIVFTFIWIIIDGPKFQKLAIFRRFFTMMSILYIGRSICVVTTQLPTPFRSDTYQLTQWNGNLFYEAFLVLCRVKATNNDVFYSGHTVVITICAVLIETYCTRKWLIWLLWIYSIFTLYVIIATKFHYTIDVFIAFVLSIVIWKFYHMTMTIKIMRNHLPIFKWFESDKEVAIFSASSSNINGSLLTTSLTTSNVLNEYNYNLNKIQLNNHIFNEISQEHKESNTNIASTSLKSISMDLP